MVPPRGARQASSPPEIFHEVLVHRWFLSERAGHEVDIFEAARDYIDTVLTQKPEEAVTTPGRRPGGAAGRARTRQQPDRASSSRASTATPPPPGSSAPRAATLHEPSTCGPAAGRTDLVPVGPLRMYACGITPYDVTHVGHAATFVWADLVRSVVRSDGVATEVARNVTDVDDVLTHAAWRQGLPFDELALTQEFRFDRDMRALAVAPPDADPARAQPRRRRRPARRGAAGARRGLRARAASSTSGAATCRAQHGLDEAEALRLSTEYGDQAAVAGPRVPVRRPGVAALVRGPPGLAEPVGLGTPGLARRVRRDGDELASAARVDVLARRRRPRLPAPRLPGGDGRGGHRRHAVRAHHDPRRRGPRRRGQDEQVDRQPRARRRPAPALPPRRVRLALLHRRWAEPWDCEEAVFERADRMLTSSSPRPGPARRSRRRRPCATGCATTSTCRPASSSRSAAARPAPTPPRPWSGC